MKKVFLFIAMVFSMIDAVAFRIEYGSNVTISKAVQEDLYITGGTVIINAPIYGDLVIAGGTIIINDTVTNDILLAGGEVTFNGFVGEDIRCAGGNIRISKNVTGDVLVTGGTIIIDKGITIGGLLASGGKLTVNGNVNGEVKGAFGDFILNGNVAKGLDCRGGKITVNGTVNGPGTLAANSIVIGNNAAFYSDVRYWNKKGTPGFEAALRNSKAILDPSLRIRDGEWYYLGAASILGVLWYLGMALLMIFIVHYLFSTTIKKAADTVFNSSLKSLGIGFLFVILVPIAALLALATLIGLPVALLLLFIYITTLLLATVISALVIANWLNNRYTKGWTSTRLVFAAFGIFILLKLISLTPFVGWVVMTCIICMAFGGILQNINWRHRRNKIAINQNPVLQ